jgi:peroxiredoxin
MRISRLTLVCFAALSAITAPALVGQRDVRAQLVAQGNRKAAPAFRLAGETGKLMQVSDYRGKVVLLNFWATECGGCVLEIPSFIELEQAYKDKGFTAVGVAMDISYEDLKGPEEAWGKVRPFVAAHKLNYPILMGDNAISRDYHIDQYPATYLIDKSGRVAATYVGIVSKDNVDSNIKILLSEH